jgi:hypothetical protein
MIHSGITYKTSQYMKTKAIKHLSLMTAFHTALVSLSQI